MPLQSIDQWLRNHPNVKRRLKKLIAAGIVAATICLAVFYFAARWKPSFYLPSLDVAHVDYEVIENQLGELFEAMQTPGDWEFTFSDTHINKWLDTDLKKHAPRMIPGFARDPRIDVRNSDTLVACEYNNGNVSLVLSCLVEGFVTGKPNEVGIRISNAKVGAVPGLTAEAMTQIRYAVLRGGTQIRWTKTEGNPEAVINIPRRKLQALDKTITVNEISLSDGHIIVAGTTEYEPLTPQRRKFWANRIRMAMDHVTMAHTWP